MTTTYKCAGFLYLNDRMPTTDPEDLYDFQGKRWTAEELNYAMNGEVLPEGMILTGAKEPMVIKKCSTGGFRLKNLSQALLQGA